MDRKTFMRMFALLGLVLSLGVAGSAYAQAPAGGVMEATGGLVPAGNGPVPATDLKGAAPDAMAADAAGAADAATSAFPPGLVISPIRVWTTSGIGAPKTQFVPGEAIRLYFQAHNRTFTWLSARLVMTIGETRHCFTTPCVPGNLQVIFSGVGRFPPGYSTWYVPARIALGSPGGSRTLTVDIGGSAMSAEFQIVPGGGGPVNVALHNEPNFGGVAVTVGPGATRLADDFTPRSLRFSGGAGFGWRLDLYGTICPFAGPCYWRYLGTFTGDHADLGHLGTGPYLVNLHR